jgi:hypothetical protein
MNGLQQKSQKFREEYDGKWVYSYDGVDYLGGPFDTKVEAQFAALNSGFESDFAYIAQVDIIYPMALVDPQEILDNVQARAKEIAGDKGSDKLTPTAFAKQRLMVILSAFLDENFAFDFFSVHNVTKISMGAK